MKTWNTPVVEELNVVLTADGTHGHNDENWQYQVPSNEPTASNPGDKKDSYWDQQS